MADWPVMLHVAGRRCVVLGGGAVAERRARSLLEAGAVVTVVAPRVTAGLDSLGVSHEGRDYQDGDLSGAFLAVIATNDAKANEAAATEAAQQGVLANRTDAPRQGDFSVPAHAHHGPVTVAVDIRGISAAASAAIRRELSAALDPDWPRLLELAEPFRDQLQQQIADPESRRDRLRRLTDNGAMNTLKNQGAEAARARMHRIAEGENPDSDF